MDDADIEERVRGFVSWSDGQEGVSSEDSRRMGILLSTPDGRLYWANAVHDRIVHRLRTVVQVMATRTRRTRRCPISVRSWGRTSSGSAVSW